MSRQDIKQQVTDSVIAALEKGGLKEWTRPWAMMASSAGGGVPWNFATKKPYQGINFMILMMACMEMRFSSTAFLTFNQVKQLGGNVRKGEKGTSIVVYKIREVSVDDADNDGEVREIPFARSFTVFNTDQCDGLLELPEPAPLLDTDGKLAKIEAICQRLCDDGLTYTRIGNRAFYRMGTDSLCMPAGEWNSTDDFCATLAHEMVHATQPPHRLDRRALTVARFKNKPEIQRYAFEELVAELGAAMLCAELGITGEMQHESYIASWLEALKNDKTYIFKAAALASQAHRYLMGEAVAAETAPEQSEAA